MFSYNKKVLGRNGNMITDLTLVAKITMFEYLQYALKDLVVCLRKRLPYLSAKTYHLSSFPAMINSYDKQYNKIPLVFNHSSFAAEVIQFCRYSKFYLIFFPVVLQMEGNISNLISTNCQNFVRWVTIVIVQQSVVGHLLHKISRCYLNTQVSRARDYFLIYIHVTHLC